MLNWMFAPVKTPREILKETQAQLRKSSRQLERDIEKHTGEATAVEKDIRLAVKGGNITQAQQKARQLVRTRNLLLRSDNMLSRMRDMGAQLSQMSTTAEMTAAMRNATLAMQRMNAQIDMPAMRAMLRQYERESMGFEEKQEMMDGTLDSVLEEDGDAVASDELVQRIVEELTLETLHAVGPMPVKTHTSISATSIRNTDNINNNNNN